MRKTISCKSSSERRWRKILRKGNFFLVSFSLTLLFFNPEVSGQESFSETPESDWFKHGFNALFIILIILTIYIIREASGALRERGHSLQFRFTLFRSMARNNKVVSSILLLIVIAGIVWAIRYKAG